MALRRLGLASLGRRVAAGGGASLSVQAGVAENLRADREGLSVCKRWSDVLHEGVQLVPRRLAIEVVARDGLTGSPAFVVIGPVHVRTGGDRVGEPLDFAGRVGVIRIPVVLRLEVLDRRARRGSVVGPAVVEVPAVVRLRQLRFVCWHGSTLAACSPFRLTNPPESADCSTAPGLRLLLRGLQGPLLRRPRTSRRPLSIQTWAHPNR